MIDLSTRKKYHEVVRQHYLAQYPADSACSRYSTMMLNIAVPASTVGVNLTPPPKKTQILHQNKVSVFSFFSSQFPCGQIHVPLYHYLSMIFG
ncbi:unnamed protein product [Oncorhynchus mykiss]|uniref:Uncharacterized protein n=1 Tax=Oncorhynchus mykiss TaxID=8022 RepID=A0A060VYB5_ONCMY|nr:unnamed protein product [Oncorhynchus mykiss]